MKYIKHLDGSKIFFTSDTHFYHENIMKYSNRPFKNADEMNEYIIEQWNNVVPEDGIVYHLGDFGFGTTRNLVKLIKRLNGKINLITGNHDRKQLKDRVYESCFESVSMQRYIYVEGQAIYLNHVPFLCYDGVYRQRKTWQLFGHVHTTPMGVDGLDGPRLAMLFPTQYDVGVDNNGFCPISFNKVRDIINKQIENYNYDTIQ